MINLNKFKKIKKTDSIFLAGNLICSGHWLFCIDWVNSLGTPRATMGLRRAIARTQLDVVTARINNESCRAMSRVAEIEKLYARTELTNYCPVNLADVIEKIDFKDVPGIQRDVVAMVINAANGEKIGIDVEYYAAFLFDKAATILARGKNDPILVQKNNRIVAMVMPLRLTDEVK
jgi:hypothetical protein